MCFARVDDEELDISGVFRVQVPNLETGFNKWRSGEGTEDESDWLAELHLGAQGHWIFAVVVEKSEIGGFLTRTWGSFFVFDLDRVGRVGVSDGAETVGERFVTIDTIGHDICLFIYSNGQEKISSQKRHFSFSLFYFGRHVHCRSKSILFCNCSRFLQKNNNRIKHKKAVS